LRLELEPKRLEATLHGGREKHVTRPPYAPARSSELTAFIEGKDDLDSY